MDCWSCLNSSLSIIQFRIRQNKSCIKQMSTSACFETDDVSCCRFLLLTTKKYHYNDVAFFLSKNYKTSLVRNISLVQPGRNMSKLLNAIMTNYDRNIRPFYGGKIEQQFAGLVVKSLYYQPILDKLIESRGMTIFNVIFLY